MAQLPEKWTKTFVSFYDLAVDDHGVLLPDGRHAGILYRLHPLELLVEETGPDGFLLGTKLLELYKCGKFMLFKSAGEHHPAVQGLLGACLGALRRA